MFEIGSSLREARRRRQLQFSEVERATRIRIQQLQALEDERFELLPPDPYRRAFLREYAEFLGLDGDLYASEYDLRFHPPEPATVTPTWPPVGRTRLLGGRPLLRIGGALVLVLVGVAVWQLGRTGGGTPTPTPPAPTTTHVHARRHRHHAAAAKPAPARAAAVLVVSAAGGRCWLWVRRGSAAGPTIYERTLAQGQTLRFGLRRRLWIRIGAPWNLTATLAGRTLTLPARTGDVLATSAGLTPAP